MTEGQQRIKDLLDLFELWKEGIFKRNGIVWTQYPPAICAAKQYLEKDLIETEL